MQGFEILPLTNLCKKKNRAKLCCLCACISLSHLWNRGGIMSSVYTINVDASTKSINLFAECSIIVVIIHNFLCMDFMNTQWSRQNSSVFSVHATNLLRVHAKNMRTYAGEFCLKSTEWDCEHGRTDLRKWHEKINNFQ